MNDLAKARDLPTYELAKLLESIPESSAELAKQLGRSRTYVSKLRSTWRGACPSLLRAWKENKLAFDVVKRIAKIKDKKEQARALADYLRTTQGRTRAAKGEARKTLIHILTCDMDEDCLCDYDQQMEADQLEADIEQMEKEESICYNCESSKHHNCCQRCGEICSVMLDYCTQACQDQQTREDEISAYEEKKETMSETNDERRH